MPGPRLSIGLGLGAGAEAGAGPGPGVGMGAGAGPGPGAGAAPGIGRCAAPPPWPPPRWTRSGARTRCSRASTAAAWTGGACARPCTRATPATTRCTSGSRRATWRAGRGTCRTRGRQGLSLVHFSAQRKCLLLDRGRIQGLHSGGLWGILRVFRDV